MSASSARNGDLNRAHRLLISHPYSPCIRTIHHRRSTACGSVEMKHTMLFATHTAEILTGLCYLGCTEMRVFFVFRPPTLYCAVSPRLCRSNDFMLRS